MLSSYAELSSKLIQYIANPTLPSQPTSTPSLQLDTLSDHKVKQHPYRSQDEAIPLRDLSRLHREFKIQGGQISDQNSDKSHNSICKQIDEGFSEAEVVRGVLKVIRAGHFKDMLMHKDDLTITELKCFLQSHLRWAH